MSPWYSSGMLSAGGRFHHSPSCGIAPAMVKRSHRAPRLSVSSLLCSVAPLSLCLLLTCKALNLRQAMDIPNQYRCATAGCEGFPLKWERSPTHKWISHKLAPEHGCLDLSLESRQFRRHFTDDRIISVMNPVPDLSDSGPRFW
jgi:hypothetical protein